jgi:hypothetical protein
MYQPSGFTSATMMAQYRIIWIQPMAVIVSNLSNRLRAQQQGEHPEQEDGQQYVRHEELPEHEHCVAQNRSGRSSA